uniref:Choline transporter-like protein n=1 Tax=Peronospora matthiolae TaxID=2874970 RepID=A0AAV1T2F7_9STRA
MFTQSYTDPSVQSVPDVTPIKPEQKTVETSTKCQDWPFALLFVLNVGTILALMLVWGVQTVTDPENHASELLPGNDTQVVLAIATAMAVLSMVLALVMVKLFVAHARVMILFVLWFNVGISFAFAAYGVVLGNIFIAIIGFMIALLNLCYARAVQHRIPFAVANLRVAEGAIRKHSSTYIVSIVFTIVQIVWVIIWALALLGVANKIAKANPSSTTTTTTTSTRSAYRQSGASYIAFFFLLLSFYWGLQVFKNVAHTTVAGTVATFWYNTESAGATGASLKRSTTSSFGSICFGSLIVAFLQALRSLAESGRQDGSALACFAECILGCLQSLMEYFNRWAYVYVGIYGYNFTRAGKAVFELFKQRGFDAIINDDLIGNVLGFAALGIGLICAAAGAVIAETTDAITFQNSTAFLAILGLIVGIGVAVTPLAVIDSSVATIFVCFAEDPAAFQQSHPELYAPLVQEWHNLYPDVMVQAGYSYA